MYEIEKLKETVKDESILLDNSGNIKTITRHPNNVVKLDRRLVSWKHIKKLLETGEYRLIIDHGQIDGPADVERKIKRARGGVRVAGPGKTLGRNKIDSEEKKKVVSVSLGSLDMDRLKDLCQENSLSRSAMISELINNRYMFK